MHHHARTLIDFLNRDSRHEIKFERIIFTILLQTFVMNYHHSFTYYIFLNIYYELKCFNVIKSVNVKIKKSFELRHDLLRELILILNNTFYKSDDYRHNVSLTDFKSSDIINIPRYFTFLFILLFVFITKCAKIYQMLMIFNDRILMSCNIK